MRDLAEVVEDPVTVGYRVVVADPLPSSVKMLMVRAFHGHEFHVGASSLLKQVGMLDRNLPVGGPVQKEDGPGPDARNIVDRGSGGGPLTVEREHREASQDQLRPLAHHPVERREGAHADDAVDVVVPRQSE